MNTLLFFYAKSDVLSCQMFKIMNQIASTGIPIENICMDEDVLKPSELIRKYKIISTPVIVKINPHGIEYARLKGYHPFDRVYEMYKIG